MPVASIRFDQPGNASPTGQAGRARRDILLSAPVTLRNSDNTGVRRWSWTLLAKPPGSTATVVNPTSAVATITPDKHGWYRIGLAINTGQASLNETQIRCFAVPDTADQAIPAAGSKGAELNYDADGQPNTQGWAREVNEGPLKAADNRHAAVSINVAGGATQNFTIAWGKPDALLQMMSLFSNGTSTGATVSLYSDAARTDLICEFGPIDPSVSPYLFNRVTMLTGAAGPLENETIYGKLENNDVADGSFELAWRLRSV